jgi:hypothetical protein
MTLPDAPTIPIGGDRGYEGRHVLSLSELLLDHVRACVGRGGPETWRSPDGNRRLLGPVSATYSFLSVMVFEGPEAEECLRAYVRPAGDADIEPGFGVIANLTAEIGRPALLVEPIPLPL